MLCLLFATGGVQARPRALDLTILHTNDVHGHLFPFAYSEVGRRKDELPSVGGAARRATLIRRLRTSIHHPVLVVDSGDTFTRGPLTNAYEGIADIEAMNAIGYDVAAIGNNEFKAKDGREQNDAKGAQAALLRVVKRSRFAWICANAKDSRGAFLEGVEPYVVREMGGVRVGLLGLTAPRSATYPQTMGWKITDPQATADEWVPKARANCDVLIAMTHIGVLLDVGLATHSTGFDAIVGGDSHTFLYKALEPKNRNGVSVPIVQDGEFGVNLGRFDLHFELDTGGRYHLTRYHYELVPVSAGIPEASDVAAILAPYRKPLDEVIGRISEVGSNPERRQRLTGEIVAEAVRQSAKVEVGISTTNRFFDVFRRTQVTKYDIWAAMPFKDNVVSASVLGSRLLEILGNRNVACAGITSLSKIDPAKTYMVAFVDYEATGTFKLPASTITDSQVDVREAIVSYLSDRRPIESRHG